MLRVLQRASLTQRQRCRALRVAVTQLRPRLQNPPLTIQYGYRQSRTLSIASIPTILLPPVVFTGLVIVLWAWKCFMMVVFQNKIIYMPGLPPNARREKIADYKNLCSGIQWQEERIRAADGTRISLCVASVINGPDLSQPMKVIYILYFQGNASSIPPRLPFLSPVMRMLRDGPSDGSAVRYIMVCCSYRGYWTSRGRPSERGIALDTAASLEWIKDSHEHRVADSGLPEPIQVVLWGQSIGAGVATNLAAQHDFKDIALKTLILETPFVSVRAMLDALYPQKWLPYRYLWPFLRNRLDSMNSIGELCNSIEKSGTQAPNILILEAGKDELVPSFHGEMLKQRCMDLKLDVSKKVVSGALHTEAMVRPEGRDAIVEAVRKAIQS